MASARIMRSNPLRLYSMILLLVFLIQGCAYGTSTLRYPWRDVLTAAIQKARVTDSQAVLVRVHISSFQPGHFMPPFLYFFDFAKEDNTILDIAFDESNAHPVLRLVGTQGIVEDSDRITTRNEREQVRAIWSQSIIPPDTAAITASKHLPPDFDQQTAITTLILLAGPPTQKAEHAQMIWKALYTSNETTYMAVMDALTGALIRTSR